MVSQRRDKCGAPQASRVSLLVWNVMHDFLRMDLPGGRMTHLSFAPLTTSES